MEEDLVAVVDSRLWLPPGLPRDLARDLRARFVHSNPEYHKKKALGFAVWGTRPTVKTWQEREDALGKRLTLPVGGLARLREVAAEHGRRVRYVDRRTSARVEFPTFRIDPSDPSKRLRPYQSEAIEAALARRFGVIRAPTGCLSGSSTIGLNRAGKSFRCRIDRAVEMMQGGVASGNVWDPSIPTMIRARCPDGFVRLFEVGDVWASGRKEIFRVVVESGRSIEATAEHRFATPFGWAELRDLNSTDVLAVESGLTSRGPGERKWYRLVNGLRFHPFAGRRGVNKGGWSVPFHRLVAEAEENGIEIELYIRRLRSGDVEGLRFVDPRKFAVHHVDGDVRNNSPENLEILTHAEHRTLHGAENWKNVTSSVGWERIVSIEPLGEDETYDLEVPEVSNFVANGFVVHNSGKTAAALAFLHQAEERALVIVRDGNLQKQWVQCAVDSLGLKRREVGVIKGGKPLAFAPRLTVALQQTLWKRVRELEQLLRDDPIGAVVVDEAQTVAAKTFTEVIDVFPTRYRIGFSANERRRDKMEFLVYDALGPVIYEIESAELEQSGAVLPVTVRIVETNFRADWYRDAEPRDRDFGKLVEEMVEDDERNALLESVFDEIAREEETPAIAFTHRRDHAREFSVSRLRSRGVRCGLLLGGTGADGERYALDIAEIRSGVLPFAIGTYNALGVGIDLPNVRAGICATPISGNNRQFFGQVRGRLARTAPGKERAILYYLHDRHVFPGYLRQLESWNVGTIEVRDGSGWRPIIKSGRTRT